jgi:hypothetical protein
LIYVQVPAPAQVSALVKELVVVPVQVLAPAPAEKMYLYLLSPNNPSFIMSFLSENLIKINQTLSFSYGFNYYTPCPSFELKSLAELIQSEVFSTVLGSLT